MLNKIRKNLKDKAGFTLVELIVVLVILAILAAMLVPALTGYIDKANQEKIVAECRQVVMAAQTEASTLYGKADGGKIDTADNNTGAASSVAALSETKGNFTVTIFVDGTINTVVYEHSGWQITYTGVTDSGYVGTYSEPTKEITTNITTNSFVVKAKTTGE